MKNLFLSLSLLSLSPVLAMAQSSTGLLLVTNKGDHTLSIVDPVKFEQIAAVPEDGVTGHEVCASPDGKKAFVPIYGNTGLGGKGTDGQLIRVIDLASASIVGTIDFGRGVRPHLPVTCLKTGLIYVTTELENSISIIDPVTLKIIGSVPTGKEQSHMLAITKDGKRGYTTNVNSGTVSVLDLENRKLLEIIPVSKSIQRISLSVDDKLVFTADQSAPRLAVIDTATNQVKTMIDLPDKAYGTASTPDGKYLLAALIHSNQVARIDLSTMKADGILDVPKSPQSVLIRPDGAYAFVTCDSSAEVAAINLKDWKVEKLIATGKGTDGLAWAESR